MGSSSNRSWADDIDELINARNNPFKNETGTGRNRFTLASLPIPLEENNNITTNSNSSNNNNSNVSLRMAMESTSMSISTISGNEDEAKEPSSSSAAVSFSFIPQSQPIPSFVGSSDNLDFHNNSNSKRKCIIAHNSKRTFPDLSLVRRDKELREMRKKYLKEKVLNAFMQVGIEKKGRELNDLKDKFISKTEESAARRILHTLLLNSYRKNERKIAQFLEEKFQLQNSVENLCLQLRVVRHLHSNEKEKAVGLANQVKTVQQEFHKANSDLEKNKTELEKVEDELNSMQGKLDDMYKENLTVKNELRILAEKKEISVKQCEFERKKIAKLEQLNYNLKEKETESKLEINELTTKMNHWQEKAIGYENDVYKAKMRYETLERGQKELQEEITKLNLEKGKIFEKKEKLENALNKCKKDLSKSEVFIKELEKKLKENEIKFQEQIIIGEKLTSEVVNLKDETNSVKELLKQYALKNVQRRANWANSFFIILNPLGWARFKFFGSGSSGVSGEGKRNNKNGTVFGTIMTVLFNSYFYY